MQSTFLNKDPEKTVEVALTEEMELNEEMTDELKTPMFGLI